MSAAPREDAEDGAQERLRAFLLDDYKLKVGYLTNHFTRMWTRFNFFITLETLVGGALIAAAANDRWLDNPWQVALLGLLISICWYLVGAQDRYLIAVYRSQIRWTLLELARNRAFDVVDDPRQIRIGALLMLKRPLDTYAEEKTTDGDFLYPYTGGTRPMADIDANWLQWRLRNWSVTTWPALLPVIASLLWLAVLVFTLVNRD